MPDPHATWADELVRSLEPHWRTQPATLRPESLPAEVPDRATLDLLLDTGALHVPYIQVFADSTPVAPARFARTRTVLGTRAAGFVDADAVRALVDGGATVMLPRLDHWYRPVIRLARALDERIGRRVDAFAFYTPPGEQGLPVHRDDADVVLLQTDGSKRWTVHAGPADGAWDPGPVATPGDPVFETELRAGEILYIPRGFAHAGVGGDDVSAHLSLVIAQAGTSELRHALRRLVEQTGRERPPRPLDEQALTDTAAQLLTDLRHRLDDLTPRQLVAMAGEVPHLNLRHELGLPDR